MTPILLTLFISYILLFLISIKIKDNSIVDIFWGFGFIIISVLSFFHSRMEISQIILTGLVLLWWIRIVFHIWVRKLKEKNEDARYVKWREEWGSGWYFYLRSFLQVYLLQMLLMLVVASAILVVNTPELSFRAEWNEVEKSLFLFFWADSPTRGVLTTSFLGMIKSEFLLILWTIIALFWLIFETIADRQLAEFMKTKKPGEIFTSWLYRYSRHPNYFGESMFWLGISLIALPFSYFWFISWFTITILLLFVSGVPLQEARYAGRPNWEEYKKNTSVFVPWIPKK